MRQDKSASEVHFIEYNGKDELFQWKIAEFEAGFTKVDGKYRASYLLARDSFLVGGRLASINYSFVYSASKDTSASAPESFPLDLDEDLYRQLEESTLKSNTDFNALLPTAEESEFFNRN